MILLAVRARLARNHRQALLAPRRVLELQRHDAQGLRVDPIEDLLRVVRAVVAAHPRMIPPDDKVRAAVVLADDRVQHRLARARVPHRRRHHRQHHPILVVVALDQHLVAPHPHVRGYVVAFRVTHQRVDQKPVADLQGTLGQVLVGPVDRVAGLERRHRLPAALGKRRPRLRRGQPVLGEVGLVVRLDHLDRPSQAHVPARVERLDAGVGPVARAVDGLGLGVLVAGELLGHRQHRHRPVLLVRQADPLTDRHLCRRRRIDRADDGDRPRQAGLRQLHPLADAAVVSGTHEPFQRAERPDGDHLDVALLLDVEDDPRQGLALRHQFRPARLVRHPVHQPATMRLDQAARRFVLDRIRHIGYLSCSPNRPCIIGRTRPPDKNPTPQGAQPRAPRANEP